MKILPSPLLAAGFILMIGGDCRSSEKPMGRHDGPDGGYITRKECNKPSFNCYENCAEREEVLLCGRCCSDQRLLCDTQQPHSFEACESVGTKTQDH